MTSLTGQQKVMRHLILLFKIVLFFFVGNCYAEMLPSIRNLDRAFSIEEEDGSPSLLDVRLLKVSNDALVDNADGSATLLFLSTVSADARFVNVPGDTMTGALGLPSMIFSDGAAKTVIDGSALDTVGDWTGLSFYGADGFNDGNDNWLLFDDQNVWSADGQLTVGDATYTMAFSTGAGTLNTNADVLIENQAELQLQEASAGGTNYTGFKAPAAIASNFIYTLPTAVGGAGEVFTDAAGDGILSWAGVTSIQDADNDTKIQTEESSDEDIIRFDIAGTEQIRLEDGKLRPTTNNDIDLGQTAAAATIDQSSSDGTDNGVFGNTRFMGQSFTTGGGITSLVGVALRIKDVVGLDSDEITVDIFLSDTGGNDDKPTGGSLGSKTIPTITDTSYDWRDFIFDTAITVSASTKYVIVVQSPLSASIQSYRIEQNTATGSYANGKHVRSTDSGSSYTVVDVTDLNFRTFSALAVDAFSFKDLFIGDIAATDIALIGNLSLEDDKTITLGTDSDWLVKYDEATDNQLLFVTTNTSATATTDPLFQILVGTTPTADQQIFGIAKGTQVSNTPLFTIDEDGDIGITNGAKIEGGFLRIGSGGTVNFADGDGDLYVWKDLEIDGTTYFKGGDTSAIFPDSSDLQFGTGGDTRIRWSITGEDYFDIQVRSGGATGSGNIIINSELGAGGTAWGHSQEVDPHLRIQSSDETSVNDFIQFWHDQTDGNIEVGAGDLNLISAVGFEFQTAADTDLVMTFVGTTSTGVFTWMEDEDYFQFADKVIFDVTVGIGTASPQELLHVGAGTDASDISATGLLVTRAGPSNLSVRDSTNGVETFLFASSVGGIMGTVTNDPLNIQTNNTSAIFIDASQNVGITVTDPDSKLEVNGDVHIDGDLFFETASSGLFYGNMDQSAGAFNVTLTTINVWVELDAATTNIVAGPLNDITFDGDHFLKVNTTGVYTIVYSLIPAVDSVAGGDQHIEFQVFKNGAVTGKGETHVTFKNILRELPVASDTLLSLTAGDEISIGARNTSSSGKIISVDHLEMTMVMVGG